MADGATVAGPDGVSLEFVVGGRGTQAAALTESCISRNEGRHTPRLIVANLRRHPRGTATTATTRHPLGVTGNMSFAQAPNVTGSLPSRKAPGGPCWTSFPSASKTARKSPCVLGRIEVGKSDHRRVAAYLQPIPRQKLFFRGHLPIERHLGCPENLRSQTHMNCRLSQKPAPLIRAHIIPRSFFGAVRAQSTHAVLINTGSRKYSSSTQSGVFDKTLLCASCDRLLGIDDGYAHSALGGPPSNSSLVLDRDGEPVAFQLPEVCVERITSVVSQKCLEVCVSRTIMPACLALLGPFCWIPMTVSNSNVGSTPTELPNR
jgi:hypothetical protein